jgi:RNA recognition motif-containing protein
MRDRVTNKPRGFGFVTFKEQEAADRAFQDEHVLDGRTVSSQSCKTPSRGTGSSSCQAVQHTTPAEVILQLSHLSVLVSWLPHTKAADGGSGDKSRVGRLFCPVGSVCNRHSESSRYWLLIAA